LVAMKSSTQYTNKY